MKSIWTQLLFVSLAFVPRLAEAQGADPMPTLLVGAPAAASFGQHEALASLILVAVTVLVLLAIGKAVDFRLRREEGEWSLNRGSETHCSTIQCSSALPWARTSGSPSGVVLRPRSK